MGTAIYALLTGNPGPLLEVTGGMAAMNVLAKLMFTPSAAKLLTEAVAYPLGAPLQLKALASLQLLAKASQEAIHQEQTATASTRKLSILPTSSTAAPPRPRQADAAPPMSRVSTSASLAR